MVGRTQSALRVVGRLAGARRLGGAVMGLVMVAAACAPAWAEPVYNVEVLLLGGGGGSLDVEPGDGFGNTTLQLGVGVPTEPGTVVGVRVGRIAIEPGERFGPYLDAELQYVNVAGEYRFSEAYYRSGLYLGLGGYRLAGDRAHDGKEVTRDALGLTFGVTADFALTRRISLALELAGHYVDFDEAQLFATGLGGLKVRF